MQHDLQTFLFVLNDRGTGCEMHLLVEGLGDKMTGQLGDNEGRMGEFALCISTQPCLFSTSPQLLSDSLQLFFFFFQMQVTVKNVLVQYLHRSGAGTGR